jgi:LysR family glycine cleavage system transcriptional activator
MSRRLPSFNALAAFEAFARHGRMTRAAEELCVTHGAVSRQIKALEAQLGAALVTGPRHGLTLTPAGLTLAQGLTAAFQTVREALPPDAAAKAGGPLRLSCNGTFAMRWLIPRLQRFVALRPDLTVEVSESHAPVDFTRGDYDAAIRLTTAPVGPGQVETLLMPHAFGPVIAPESGPLEAQPRLNSRTHPPAWAEWIAASGAQLPPSTATREFDHMFYMLEAAASGLGAAIGSWPLVAQDIERGRLEAPFGFTTGKGRIALFAPARAPHPGVAPLRAWLLEEAASMARPVISAHS